MSILRKIFTLTALFVCFSFAVNAQSNQDNLNNILDKTQKEAEKYSEVFQNLFAVENRTLNVYVDDKIKKTKTVKSNFIVYATESDGKSSVAEYRNVLVVNGKPVNDSEKRVEKLFAKIENSKSVEDELKKIKKESLRYDDYLEFYGFTLNQFLPLKNNLKPLFDFRLNGRETLNGREVYVVEYQQIKPDDALKFDVKISKKFAEFLKFDFENEKPLSRFRGKLWIDVQNFQIWREEREIYVSTENGKSSFRFFAFNFENQPSEFEIVVPKKIIIMFFIPKVDKLNYSLIKDREAIIEYSDFRKPNANVEKAVIN